MRSIVTLVDADRRSVFVLIGLALPLAAVLVIASSVAESFGDAGDSIRDRIFVGSQGAGPFAASLVLGAAVIMFVRSDLCQTRWWDRWALVAIRVVAISVIGAAIYAVWYALTLHVQIPGPNSPGNLVIGFGYQPWSERLRVIFAAGAGALIGLVTLLTVRQPSRHGNRTDEPISAA